MRRPDQIADPLTDILRAGARELIARAVEIEFTTFLETTKHLTLSDGRARLVRHGYGPTRAIATGIGPVVIARPKARDRGASGPGDRIRFLDDPAALGPPGEELGRVDPRALFAGNLDQRLSGGTFGLARKDAPNLSPPVIAGLKKDWHAEYERCQKRDLSARRYV